MGSRRKACAALAAALLGLPITGDVLRADGSRPGAPPRPCAGCDAPVHPILRSSNPEIIPASRVRPRYPRRARRLGIEGQVVLQCVVRRDGTVGRVEALRASAPGHGLEEAAAKAVRRWRFVPATFNGEAIDVYFTVVVEFRLDDRPASGGDPSPGGDGRRPGSADDHPHR